MAKVMRKAAWLLVALLLAAALVLLARVLTEYWWFIELGHPGVFWRLQGWRWGLRLLAFVSAWLFLYGNLRLTQPAIFKAVQRFADGVPRLLRWPNVRRAFLVASALLALPLSGTIAEHWDEAVRFVYGPSFGVADPLFGKDVGFYVFRLPFWRLLHSAALSLVVMTAVLVLGVYVAARVVEWRSPRVEGGPRRHVLFLAAAFALLVAAGHRLSLYALLYSDHSPVFYGASYTDWHARAVALRVLFVLALAGAAALVYHVFRPRPKLLASLGAAWLGAAVLLGGVYPALLQRFVVEPNELQREERFIQHHLRFTRLAYGVDDVEEIDFEVVNDLTWEDLPAHAAVLDNARLWDWRPLKRTYEQLQSIRFYYTFPDVDVDRYVVNGQLRQVMLAARELDLSQIPNPTWVNQHLQYTHGYGLVMSPVREATPQGQPRFYLADIPPRPRNVDITVERPEIYFGELTNHYVVVRTRTPDFEFSYPSGDDNVRTTYAGKGGVPMGSLWRRAAFALRMGTINLLFSDQIGPETRILFHRNVRERVARLAPFLRFDRDPYPVVADGRIFWIIDAYTTSNAFPYALPHPEWNANYVRNAVKAVVDAYHGTVDFYIFDDTDPVIQAYAAAFPNLFRPADEMPAALRAHVRYPQDLFRLQAEIYGLYHMRNPTLFYNREDVWRFAREVFSTSETTRTREEVMEPYYVIVHLPDEPEPEMVLMMPFTPSERNNMIAWMAARMDGDNYGRLLTYRFPKDELVYGPMQIEARIDQHPDIAQLLTLWAQRGSSVIRGNMLVLPIGRSLLYLKPIYLQAETSDLPELVRVIAAFGDNLSMQPTLEEALRSVLTGGAAVAPADGLAEAAPEGPRSVEALPEREPGGVLRANERTDAVAALATEALALYGQAQERLRAGDWAGFGSSLDALEAVLRRLAEAAGHDSP